MSMGVMKGVIAQINCFNRGGFDAPNSPKHRGGAVLSNECHPYFPSGTVHVVVDPGVGSTRRAVAVEFAAGFLVGPDSYSVGC